MTATGNDLLSYARKHFYAPDWNAKNFLVFCSENLVKTGETSTILAINLANIYLASWGRDRNLATVPLNTEPVPVLRGNHPTCLVCNTEITVSNIAWNGNTHLCYPCYQRETQEVTP